MRRIFVAMGVSEKMRCKVADFREHFCIEWNGPAIKWIRDEDLHLTLVPPWYVDEKDLKKIIEKLKHFAVTGFGGDVALRQGGVDINFEKIEFGPNVKKPRVIWWKGKKTPALIDLKNELENLFGQKNLEKKEFLPHITLARFGAEEFKKFPIKKLEDKMELEENLRHLSLFQSHLSNSGARYHLLTSVAI